MCNKASSTTGSVLVIIAPGVEETELVASVDMLRRGGITCLMAGTQTGNIIASREVSLHIVESVFDHLHQRWDGLLIPGGMDHVNAILGSAPLLSFIAESYTRGCLIGAICAAPLILKECGILHHISCFTSHPAVKDQFSRELLAKYSEKRVVVSGSVITSRAPGTACEFGLTLVKYLAGQSTADAVNRGVLSHW
ncbi:DJ-1/PfpI family protein [Myxococcota bacterium]|nr:DJ-1/PfpI family protein [Myxococcota bacterium]